VITFSQLPEAIAAFKRIAETKWDHGDGIVEQYDNALVQATGLETQGEMPTALSASLSIGAHWAKFPMHHAEVQLTSSCHAALSFHARQLRTRTCNWGCQRKFTPWSVWV
jgi:hypothetical protein